MATKQAELRIPDTLGIKQKKSVYLLFPKKHISQQVRQILSWILTARVVGINIPLLCDTLIFAPGGGEAVQIAENLQSFSPERDRLIHVEIPDDELVAFLSIDEPSNEEIITEHDCYFKLLQAGVRRGYQPDTILTALEDPSALPAEKVIAARGQKPDQGKDCEIIIHEELSESKYAHNSRPYKNQYVPVVKDEVIAQKLPPQKGASGYTVRGNELESPCEDTPLPQGENTYIGSDQLTLYSGKHGYLHWDGDAISVQDVLKYDGDIDYSTGDIDYDGKIIIDGDVRGGIRVKSQRDIEVYGFVEGSTLVSSEGSIRVQRGINGLEKSEILAQVDIEAEYIQDAWVSAGGSITVSRYIARSSLDAGGTITVNEKEGLIRGGVLRSERGIRSKIAGSTSCITTQLVIQPKLNEEQQQKLEEIGQSLANLEIQQNRIRRRLDFLSMLAQRQNHLVEKHRNEAQLLSEELINLSKEIVRFQDEQELIQRIHPQETESGEPLIVIDEKIYPGVKFIIEDQEFHVRKEITGGRVKFMHGKIILV